MSALFELLPPLTAESSPPYDRVGSAHGLPHRDAVHVVCAISKNVDGGSHRGWPSLVARAEAFN